MLFNRGVLAGMMGRRPSPIGGGGHMEGAHVMQSGFSNLIFIALIFGAMWFLLIRPQQQRAKKQAEMIAKLEQGTEIITVGGIYGTIVELAEERIRIRVADGSEFEIARRAVNGVVPPSEIEELEALEATGGGPDDAAEATPIAGESTGDDA